MNRRRFLVGVSTLALLSACSKFQTYNGPQVTRVLVFKGSRRMYLMHHDSVLEAYEIGLGFAPVGHKEVEGDGRTPEGEYFISHRNPNSAFHLSLGISYPNDADRAHAARLGESPGGDIFIHGDPDRNLRNQLDWTAGCISVPNRQIEEIYAMVEPGTPISIYP